MDGDLKTPKHDEIMIWLDENIQGLLCSLISFSPEWTEEQITAALKEAETQKEAAIKEIERSRRRAEDGLASCNIEYLRKRYMADLETYKQQLLEWAEYRMPDRAEIPPKSLRIIDKTWEYAIENKKFVIGFIDLSITYVRSDEIAVEVANQEAIITQRYREPTILFEVKSEIKSLGEVIRQIRMYQVYKNNSYCVVCPDDRFAAQLRAQGIWFLKYEPQKEV
jgi:hypothetical protein